MWSYLSVGGPLGPDRLGGPAGAVTGGMDMVQGRRGLAAGDKRANVQAALGALLAVTMAGAAAQGCGEPPESGSNGGLGTSPAHEREVPADQPAAPVTVYQGTVAMFGDCGIGVARVDSDYADIYTYAAGVMQSSQRWLRQGHVLLACGVPHRVLGFLFEDEVAAGSSGRALLLDGNPMAGALVKPGAVVLTMDGVVHDVGPQKVTLRGLSIAMQGPRPTARFRILLHDGREEGAIGGAGDSIEIASVRHRIIEVKLPDAVVGIPGWIQIEGAPERTSIE
jgi:hypothetical protein